MASPGYSNGRGGSDKFNPPANVPQAIALKWTDGRLCQSPFSGDQVRYVLTDDRQWYVDPAISERIQALGLAPGELFSAMKCEVMRGNRRSIEWRIARIQPEGAAERSVSPAPAPQNTPQQSTPQHSNPTATDALVATGKAAIDAVLAVEDYARQRGMDDFVFGSENVQKIWMSLYIEINRRRS